MESLENAGVQQRFVPPIIGITLLTIIGIFCNINVALTVVTSKNLRNVSNYLIALTSFGDIVHQMSNFLLIYSVISGTNVTSAKTCFIIMALPLLLADFTLCMMIWIGLDRILRIVLLNRYDIINKSAYLVFIVATSSIYGLTLVSIAFESTIAAPDAKILCFTGAILNGETPRKILLYSQLAVCGTIVFTYVVFWILFQTKDVNDVTTKLVARSVSVIVAVVMICFVLSTLVVTVAESYLSFYDFIVLWFYMGNMTNLSCSSNFVILYALNLEYRTALRTQLSWIFSWRQTRRISGQIVVSKQEGAFTRTNSGLRPSNT